MLQTRLFERWAPLVTLLPIFLAAGCKGDNASASPAARPPMPVPMMVAETKPVTLSSEYLATLKSRNFTEINPQVEGQITKIYVRSGDRVQAGAPLMQIDPLKQQAAATSQEATHAAREANLRLAREQLERTRRLAAEGVVSRQALDEAQTAYDAALADVKALEAQVTEQRVQLHYYRVSAPVGGVVGDIPVHVGDRVNLNTVLTSISPSGGLEAYVDVPVERAHALKLGKPMQLVDNTRGVLEESRITFVSPAVDNATQTVLVKAAIDNAKGGFRTDQLTRARIVWESQPAILVPVLAVSRLSGQTFVFVAEQGEKSLVAKQRMVRLGELIGNDYVVLEGLKPGDKVITGNTQVLADNTPVQQQPPQATAK
jgi:RND family efflux transporter MFP subunit